jgi:large subunit ribosomal protein L25
MKSVALNAFPRTETGRTGVKKLRRAGRIPAVVYGRKTEPRNLEVELKEIENLIHRSLSENLLVDLAVDGDADSRRLALVQDVQHHSLTGKVLHLDLREVAPDEKVTVTIPVEAVGEAVGVKTGGGVLEHVLFKIKVSALPKDLPEVLNIDVSNLNLGETIHIGEIQPPEGVEVHGDKGAPVFAIAATTAETQEAAVAETSPGEVEMIKEKKQDEGKKK